MDDITTVMRYQPPVDEEIPEEETPAAKPVSRKEKERDAKKAEEEAEQVRDTSLILFHVLPPLPVTRILLFVFAVSV